MIRFEVKGLRPDPLLFVAPGAILGPDAEERALGLLRSQGAAERLAVPKTRLLLQAGGGLVGMHAMGPYRDSRDAAGTPPGTTSGAGTPTSPGPNIRDCPDCGGVVSRAASDCPHCGRPFAAKAQRSGVVDTSMSGNAKSCLGCLGFGVLGIVFLMVWGSLGSDGTREPDPRAMVSVLCEQSVENQLRAPATADFPFVSFDRINVQGDTATYTSYVDAENGFGAMIRTDWACRAVRMNGAWRAIATLVE